MTEVTSHPVWCYLAVFFIGSLVSIFLAFEPYHMFDHFTFQCLLSPFGFSLPIKGPVQSQFQLLQNQTQSLTGEILYIVI